MVPVSATATYIRAEIRRVNDALELKTRDVEALGDTAIELGMFTVLGEGGTLLDRGKLLVIWKQQEGEWKIQTDLWNTSIPGPDHDR